MSIRVLICDDQELARAGIRFVLEASPEIEIVGEADSGRVAHDLVSSLHPDVVLMDVVMQNDNGIEAARRIIQGDPQTRLLAVSMHTDAIYIGAMMDAGALGYVDKSCAYEELTVAIREVMAGRKYLSSSLGTRKQPGGNSRSTHSRANSESGVAAPIISPEMTP